MATLHPSQRQGVISHEHLQVDLTAIVLVHWTCACFPRTSESVGIYSLQVSMERCEDDTEQGFETQACCTRHCDCSWNVQPSLRCLLWASAGRCIVPTHYTRYTRRTYTLEIATSAQCNSWGPLGHVGQRRLHCPIQRRWQRACDGIDDAWRGGSGG